MPTEDFERELLVSADARRCWDALTDVPSVVEWVSLVTEAQVEEPLKRYRALLADRLGPFTLRADLDIEVTDVEVGQAMRVRASGDDRQAGSRIVVEGRLRLAPAEEGTRISIDGRYEVTGKAASIGSSMIRKKAGKVMDDFFASAARELG